jgi:hypothetical protein
MKEPLNKRTLRVVAAGESTAAAVPPPRSPAGEPAVQVPDPSGATNVYAAVRDPRPEAIVVHCSDPRFQPAFAQFIRQELGLGDGQFIPIVVGGGAGVLGHPEQLPKEFKFLKDRFEYYREIFPTVRRLVLVNHEDCRYYEEVRSRIQHLLGARIAQALEQARTDLGLVARVFDHVLAHLGYDVGLYYARFADPERKHIVFERVDS